MFLLFRHMIVFKQKGITVIFAEIDGLELHNTCA